MPALGSTFNITATFKDTDENLIDPDDISVEVKDSNGDYITTATPQTPERLSLGRYKIEWHPTAVGSFTVIIIGTVIGSDDIVLQDSFVITEDNDDATSPYLDQDVVVVFSSGFSPLLVDPESILDYGEYIDTIQIAQLVHKFSLEVQGLFPNGNYPQVAYDYIEAATLCALSRIHEGVGSSNYSGFTLGDLQVMNTSQTSSKSANRGNISSWCELASLLRHEMRNAKGGMTSSIKAGRWGTPYPERSLRRIEHRKPRKPSRYS